MVSRRSQGMPRETGITRKMPWIYLISEYQKVCLWPQQLVGICSDKSGLALSKAKLHLRLLEEENASSRRKESTSVIAQGLKIEESQ